MTARAKSTLKDWIATLLPIVIMVATALVALSVKSEHVDEDHIAIKDLLKPDGIIQTMQLRDRSNEVQMKNQDDKIAALTLRIGQLEARK